MSQRADERATILSAIERAVTAHPAVAAAWLIGSFGRGTHDDWSDIDVWVVTGDGPATDLTKAPGEPLLTVKAIQNAPQGGAFLTCAYDAPSGPHLVDWYFQPRDYAARPDSARVMVMRAELPELPPPSPVLRHHRPAPPTPEAFWAMALVQAKAIARGARDLTVEPLLLHLSGAEPPPPGPPLQRLRALCALRSGDPIAAAVERHLAFVERSLA